MLDIGWHGGGGQLIAPQRRRAEGQPAIAGRAEGQRATAGRAEGQRATAGRAEDQRATAWRQPALLPAQPACLSEREFPVTVRWGATMAGREKLLDPTGFDERAVDTTLAPRPAGLRGLTVGLLENTKVNAALLLSHIGRELQREHGVHAAVLFTKSYFGTPTEESLIQRILHNCDFVVAGVGD